MLIYVNVGASYSLEPFHLLALEQGNLEVFEYFIHTVNTKHQTVQLNIGDVYTTGLLQRLWQAVLQGYNKRYPTTMPQAFASLAVQVGENLLMDTLHQFVALFPPSEIYKDGMSVASYLATNDVAGTPHAHVALERLWVLSFTKQNPALYSLQFLFPDETLRKSTGYLEILEASQKFFATQPKIDNIPLLEFLSLPHKLYPLSLSAQLEYIRTEWSVALQRELGDVFAEILNDLFTDVSKASDIIIDEQRLPQEYSYGFRPGPAPVLSSADLLNPSERVKPLTYERYSPDSDWMPRVVLLAKSTYVWLHQLSQQFGYEINRLTDIPDAALDEIAKQGFTALWLIGIWERSKASRTIKHRMGNSEAMASAYAIADYVVASDLGGQAACDHLRQRLRARGIRLSTDMVPNHMAIDSRWVKEHPNWFLNSAVPPYPNYTFNSADLSSDANMQVWLEDGYYTKEDAAVVFKHRNAHNGATRYIYHGNDGTSTPWNDTAQLNYLLPEVREAVIQTILHVARHSSIIRFDAAMTLTKQHIQRLWFPVPGESHHDGGAVPSRARHSMTTEEFDAHIPQEFWREVVDRVAEEAPNTLLLAEAFWLMEGYFVRTLGMHRVYNSAFMNMLAREANADYQQTLQNILAFDPRILKRFVNFLSNPDEETAVAQFGKGDKYFGICTMLVTLPGLPMFGHGQVAGWREKYGMEYRRPRFEEPVDEGFVKYHEKTIFPLMRNRHLFAEVENFLLYPAYNEHGQVNHDIYAYSNRYERQSTLVLYNNSSHEARAFIHTSVPYQNQAKNKMQRKLYDGLYLHQQIEDTSVGHVVLLHDFVSQQDFLCPLETIAHQGLVIHLRPYERRVFAHIEVLADPYGHYHEIYRQHKAKSLYDARGAAKDMHFLPLHEAFAQIFTSEARDYAITPLASLEIPATITQDNTSIFTAHQAFLKQVQNFSERSIPNTLTDRFVKQVHALKGIANIPELLASSSVALQTDLEQRLELSPAIVTVLLGYLAVHPLTLEAVSSEEVFSITDEQIEIDDAEQADESDEVTTIDEIPAEKIVKGKTPELEQDIAVTKDDAIKHDVIKHDVIKHDVIKHDVIEHDAPKYIDLMAAWRLQVAFARALHEDPIAAYPTPFPLDAEQAGWLVRLLVKYKDWVKFNSQDGNVVRDIKRQLLKTMQDDEEVQALLQCNVHAGVVWFNKEACTQWLNLLLRLALLEASIQPDDEAYYAIVAAAYQVVLELDQKQKAVNYQWVAFLS